MTAGYFGGVDFCLSWTRLWPRQKCIHVENNSLLGDNDVSALLDWPSKIFTYDGLLFQSITVNLPNCMYIWELDLTCCCNLSSRRVHYVLLSAPPDR